VTLFTSEELEAEARRLCGTTHAGFLWVRSAGPSSDLTHVQVEVHAGGLAEAAARGINADAAIASRYPVRVMGESDPIPA
jgi:hypothetical protein